MNPLKKTAIEVVPPAGSCSVGAITAVLLNDTASNGHHGSRLTVQQIREKASSAGIDVSHSVAIADDWTSGDHIAQVAAAELVIVNGEGTLHHAKRRARGLVAVAEYCKARGIACCLINSVYQANQDLTTSVRCFDLIFVREHRSHAELSKFGIPAAVVPDAIFSIDQVPTNRARSDRIVFSDSVNDGVSEQLYELSRTIKNAQFTTMRLRPSGVVTKHSALSLLAAFGLANYAPEGLRRHRSNWLIAKRDQRHFIPSAKQLVDLLATSKFLVTGRFHMVCLAMLCRTPFIALRSNTHKIEGLLEDVGLGHRLISDDRLSEALRKREFMEWSQDESASLGRYISNARCSIDGMFQTMRDCAGARARTA